MGISNILRTGRKTNHLVKVVLVAGFSLWLHACVSKKPVDDAQPQATNEYGPAPVASTIPNAEPPAPAPSAQDVDSYGPQPMAQSRLAVVLGPGMENTLSYLGALRALEEEKIPFDLLIGVEAGSLMGAVFSGSESTGKLDWNFAQIYPHIIRKDDNIVGKLFKNRQEELRQKMKKIFSRSESGRSTKKVLWVYKRTGSDSQFIEDGSLLDQSLTGLQGCGWIDAFSESCTNKLEADDLKKIREKLGDRPILIFSAQPIPAIEDAKMTGITFTALMQGGSAPSKAKWIFQGKRELKKNAVAIKKLISEASTEK